MRFLESGSQEFENNVADHCRDGGNLEVGQGKDIRESPEQALPGSHAAAFKFSHQEIGIEQEHDERDLDQSSPAAPFHGRGL